MGRKSNFNPGPAVLPEDVLKQAQSDMMNFRGLGTGIMEISHRSKEFIALLEHTQATLRRLLSLDDSTHILFCQGGARTQFAKVPMNFLHTRGAYVDTGVWSDKAIEESQRVGDTKVIATSKEQKYNHIPHPHSYTLNGDESYLHLTSNNTIYGTQVHEWPETNGVPLIVDMSSDIASRKLDYNQFDMVYAGAQKNIGTAGVTLVLLKDEFAKKAKFDHLSHMLRYDTFIQSNSLYNTPPVWSIYIVSLVLDWLEAQGGIDKVEENNTKKVELLYSTVDEMEFYTGTAQKDSRSMMNVTFRLPTEELDKRFVADGLEAGFIGLKGHRLSGGIRVSCYNAVTVEDVERLVDFMKDFAKKHG
ncbi:MAG TPA: 3-phosphoserine/phosphohydroxythreonine transaminase [Myxococcales bacterium]|nr:3-phosphoserine/phosphohydroxythreonine transaminase [Myxococcales bacterium]